MKLYSRLVFDLLFVLLAQSEVRVNGAKILLFPIQLGSHVHLFKTVGEFLTGDGHEVYEVVPHIYEDKLSKSDVKKIVYELPKENDAQDAMGPLLGKMFEDDSGTGSKDLFEVVIPAFSRWHRDILTNISLIETIESLQFDLMIMDGDFTTKQLLILPYKLDVPYMMLTFIYEPWHLGISSMPSATPNQFTAASDTLTFFETLMNLGSFVSNLFIPQIFEIQDTSTFVPDKPVLTIDELHRKSEFYFINLDNSCAEYPKLTAPNLQFLPGANVGEVKPLRKDLEEFVAGSGEHGTIITTFGTLKHTKTFYLPKMIHKLLEAFSKLPQRVILVSPRFADVKIPDNVLFADYIPQNDLLAHPKVKLFVTHGGNNGQLEAIHHGVPMVSMGVDLDQIYGGKKTEDLGFGKHLSAKYFTSNELYDAILDVMHNDTYRTNLLRCKEIRSSLPQAKEIVTFWVNHILKFGGAHLRLKAIEIPLYKLFMLDVMLFFYVVFTVVIIVLVLLCKCSFKLFRKVCTKKKQD